MGTWHVAVAAGEAQNSNKLIVDIMHYIHCIAMLGICIHHHIQQQQQRESLGCSLMASCSFDSLHCHCEILLLIIIC